MKLKARELTIYDWVLYENEPMKIAEITSCYGDVSVCFVGRNYLIDIEEISPIPLTPEILEKNGWVYDGVQLWKNEDVIALEIGCDGRNSYWWHMFDSPIAPINYVHELQHILTIMNIKETIEP